jgi:hypothetical protein
VGAATRASLQRACIDLDVPPESLPAGYLSGIGALGGDDGGGGGALRWAAGRPPPPHSSAPPPPLPPAPYSCLPRCADALCGGGRLCA